MHELEKRIGHLRILLADVAGKQTQLSEMESQYRAQLSRVVEFVVTREGNVGNALSLMSEVQAKLDEVVQTATHLTVIANRANAEFEVLLLTKRVAEARSQLARLEERQQELASKLSHLSTPDAGESMDDVEEAAEVQDIRAIYDEVEHEIARLHNLISDASERAARTVQPKVHSKV